MRISQLLRQYLRALGGEDVDPPTVPFVYEGNLDLGATSAASNHALEREIELARLERENEELRRMLGFVSGQQSRNPSDGGPSHVEPSTAESRRSSGLLKMEKMEGGSETLGPFGTYKRVRTPS